MPQGLKKIKNKFVREFIILCLSDKTSRPSATELSRHPFMQVTQEDDEIIFSLATTEGITGSSITETVRSRGNSKEVEPNSVIKPTSTSTNPNIVNVQQEPQMQQQLQEKIETNTNSEPQIKVSPKTVDSGTTAATTNIKKPSVALKPIPKTVEQNSSGTSGFKVVILDRKGLELQLKLFLRLNGTEKAIEFPFSLQSDTPEIVAQEMASELAMEEQEWIGVSDAIKFALKNNTTLDPEKEQILSDEEKQKQDQQQQEEEEIFEKQQQLEQQEKEQQEQENQIIEELGEEINFYEILKSRVPSEDIDAIKLAYEALLKKHRLERENFYQFVGLTNSTSSSILQNSPSKNGTLKKIKEPSITTNGTSNLMNGGSGGSNDSSPSKSNIESKFEKSEQENDDVDGKKQTENKNYLHFVDSLSNTSQMLNDNKITSVKSVKASIDEDIHELMIQKGGSGFSTIKASPEESFENHHNNDDNEKF